MILQRINGNWAQCLAHLGKRKLATAAQGMQDRIKKYEEHVTCGAWFAENFNCVGGTILAARLKYNPLIKYAEQAVQAQRAGEFYLTPDIVDSKGKPYSQLLVEIAQQDARKPLEEKRVVDLGKVVTHTVPTDSFADDDTIVWLAQGETLAKEYGLFLRNKLPEELRLTEVTVRHMPLSGEDYSGGFWLCWLGRGGGSVFYCNDRNLCNDYRSVFGVAPAGAREIAKGDSQKSRSPEVRVSTPTVDKIIEFAMPYIAPVNQQDFNAGLRAILENKNLS